MPPTCAGCSRSWSRATWSTASPSIPRPPSGPGSRCSGCWTSPDPGGVPLTFGSMSPLRVAVIGAGYWGPNLVRNFQANAGCDLLWVCDLDEQRARRAVGRYSTVKVTTSPEDVIGDGEVEAVAIATPAATHWQLASAALEAGKHVIVEKPLASSVEEGEAIVRLADERGLTLMSDHTYCYTPSVQRIRDLVATGTLGDIQY